MYLISGKGYENEGVDMFIIKILANLGKHDKCTRWFRS